MVLASTLVLPALLVRVVLPPMKLLAQEPPSPMTTGPVVPEIVTEPLMWLPQIVMLAAPLALRFPATVEFRRTSEAPRGTVREPPTFALEKQVVPEDGTVGPPGQQ